MLVTQFEVAGIPVPASRPRVVARNGITHSYIPKKTSKAVETVKVAAKQVYTLPPTTAAVRLDVVFRFAVPYSWNRERKRAAAEMVIYPIQAGKGDIDNLLKTVMDGISGVVIVNDAQITQVEVLKRFSEDEPCTVVSVEAL